LKKNIAKRPDATKSITTFAVRSERVRKIERRTSGAFACSSMKMKLASRIAERTNVPIVCGESSLRLRLDDGVDEATSGRR
jgi:hypothetical protein